jgi:pilus assembly protein CpaE
MNEVAVSAIEVSDVIVLLTTQDIPAIKNARLFLDLIQSMRIERDRVVFVMNRYDKRLAKITLERVSENLKQPILAAIPLDERVAIPAVLNGIPFMIDNKTQPVARGIYSLAEVVRARLSAKDNEPVEQRPAKR